MMYFSAIVMLAAVGVVSLAQQKVVWIGPIYKELAESLMRGFKDYYLRTYGEPIEVTFIRPGGWPVCVDKVREWGGSLMLMCFWGLALLPIGCCKTSVSQCPTNTLTGMRSQLNGMGCW